MIEQNSYKIPFKVSARTARLIGRENIANSKGAIIELVKNGYDADSNVSIVYFDNKLSTFSSEIEKSHFNELVDKGIDATELEDLYNFDIKDKIYRIKDDISLEKLDKFKICISHFTSLYIIDSGDGMTQNIIRDHWMTIGTDNKTKDIFTKSGRVKSGAKGIGRFALDRLGGRCQMTTVFNPNFYKEKPDKDINGNLTSNSGYRWTVDWDEFDGESRTIDTVNATLEGLNIPHLKDEITKILSEKFIDKISSEKDFNYGTILKIEKLRDDWNDFLINQVYSDLEVLVPPKETGEFEIYVFDYQKPEEYGEVLGSICDDFDYKLIAKADNEQNVDITIYRKEYDVELIPDKFFERDGMKKENYTKKDFINGYWSTKKTFSSLLKGFSEIDKDNVLGNIGNFDFTFYFLKRSSNTLDSKRFFNRDFLSHSRKQWLQKFGGIKLFRDNFRVRPYGEVNSVAFDWLGLSKRKSSSPAGVAKKDGGYKVEPENVAGAINISRLTNLNFEDKSSREGLQENKIFNVFTLLINEIISIFEEDRSYIAREMVKFDDDEYGQERDREKAVELTRKILEQNRKRKETTDDKIPLENSDTINNSDSELEKVILAVEIDRKEEEIERLKSEQKILRGLASSGIVLASFSHGLSKLNDVLSSRVNKLRDLLLSKISENEYLNTEDRKNPFILLDRIRKQDYKIQSWLNFSLGATRKDKRNRKQLYLKSYFSNLETDWETVFKERGINLECIVKEDISIRVFEIDLDSIFNNLFVNSIEAFINSKEVRKRNITIRIEQLQNKLLIEYRDNGSGLSEDISNPEDIFKPLFTTRRDQNTGDEVGTGLGMWLIKSIVEENSGSVQLIYPRVGFGMKIIFPLKYK